MHRVETEEQREHEDGRDDELEEPVSRVLGVRKADLGLDEVAAAEEISQLDEHEREEEQVQSSERDRDLGGADPRCPHVHREHTLLLFRRE